MSPYDWVVTDASGATYGAIVGGLPGGPLPELQLGPSESVRGTIGFVVPTSARGLVLHFDPQLGEDTVEIPLD